jgi:hypothetical protein
MSISNCVERHHFSFFEGKGGRFPMNIAEKIGAFYDAPARDEHHRYHSWEHCYSYFRQTAPSEIAKQRGTAALHLAFYLASWGMYRGSSFLLQRAYTVHLGVVDRLFAQQFLPLWGKEFGAEPDDFSLVPTVLAIIQAVRDAYAPFGRRRRRPTDTLVTKVILGTLGCLPACDSYFIQGFRNRGFSFSDLNALFVERLLEFCRNNLGALRTEQVRIERQSGIRYPIMKLVDMYFWQIGYELGR